LTTQAYLAWVNSLTGTQREQLGLLYDGSFELAPTNWGFDWHMNAKCDALVDRMRTFGSEGTKSLHLLFARYQGPFDGVYQVLFLDPGAYR
jgi:hypothetical protein